MYRISPRYNFSFPWEKSPGVQLLGHILGVHLVFNETANINWVLGRLRQEEPEIQDSLGYIESSGLVWTP